MDIDQYKKGFSTAVFYSEDEDTLRSIGKSFAKETKFGKMVMVAAYNMQEEVEELEGLLEKANKILREEGLEPVR